MNNIYEMLIRRSRQKDESDSSSSESHSDSSSSGGITPILPTDARYELLLNNETNTHFSGHTSDSAYMLTTYPANNYSYGTVNGITAMYLDTGITAWNLNYGSTNTSTDGNAMSVWMRIWGVLSKEGCLINASTGTSYPFAITVTNHNGEYRYSVMYRDTTTQTFDTGVVCDNLWHNFIVNHVASNTLEFWVDGVKAHTETPAQTVAKIGSGVTLHASTAANSSTPDGHFDQRAYYRNFRWFTRPLTEAEILGLAQELTPTA